MIIETDEPERGMHRMSGSSWRAVMANVSGEKLRGNLAPRSRVMMTWVDLSPLMFEPFSSNFSILSISIIVNNCEWCRYREAAARYE